jgi:hypothetical protein
MSADRKTMNTCFFLKPSLPGETHDQILIKRTRSKQIVDVQQDIEFNETVVLPCAMTSDVISLTFEVVLEKRFSEHVLASSLIEGTSLAEIIDKTMSITFRDRDGFSIALLMGRIAWSAEYFNGRGDADDGSRLDLSLDGGIEALRHGAPVELSSSIWALNPNSDPTSGDSLLNWVDCRDREISCCARSIELNLSKAIIIRIASFVDQFTDKSGLKSSSSDSLVEADAAKEKDYQNQPLMLPHKGELVALLGELDAPEIRDIILGDFASIPEMIVFSSAAYYPIDFWQHFCAATACTDRKIYLPGYERGQGRWMDCGLLSEIVKVIQTRMILGFRNYQLAEAAWRYLVAPSWMGLPRVGGFRLTAGAASMKYRPMSCPIIAGDRNCRVYVDSNATIRSIPLELRTLPLGGIMTASSDRIRGGSKLFEFEVADSCTLFLCFDSSVKSRPDWIAHYGFVQTELTVVTTASSFIIFIKHVCLEEEELTREISLGGCGLYRLSEGDNYFLLYTSLMASFGGSESSQHHNSNSDHYPPLAGCAAADCRWTIRPNAPVPTSQIASDGDNAGILYASKMQIPLTLNQDDSIQQSSSAAIIPGAEGVRKNSVISRSYLFANLNAIKITYTHEVVGGRASSLDLNVKEVELDCRMKHGKELFDLSAIDAVRAVAKLEISALLKHRALVNNALSTEEHARQILLPLRVRCMVWKDPFSLKLSTTFASLNAAVIECPTELIPLCVDISSNLASMNINSFVESSESLWTDRKTFNADNEISGTTFESWCLNNELGVDLSVRVESNIDICVFSGSMCLQIEKSSERVFIVKAGQSVSFYLMRRTCFEFSMLKDTKLLISIEGWKVDSAISFNSFGRILHRITLDEDNWEFHGSKSSGQFRASESSHSGDSGIVDENNDEFYGSCEENSEPEAGGKGDVSEGISSADDSTSVGSSTWRSVSGDELLSDEDIGNVGLTHLAPKSGNVAEAGSMKLSAVRPIRKRSKISPFAIETLIEHTPSDTKDKNKFVVILRSNVCIANESSCNLSISYLNNEGNTNLLDLVKGQRSNIPLLCLQRCKFSFAFSETKDVESSETKEITFKSVTLSPASFNALVPRALRTPKELENNSIKVQMSAQSEESFQYLNKNTVRISANNVMYFELLFKNTLR